MTEREKMTVTAVVHAVFAEIPVGSEFSGLEFKCMCVKVARCT